jgi:blue copper oxidase
MAMHCSRRNPRVPARRRTLGRIVAAVAGTLLPAARAAAPTAPVDLCTTPTRFDVPLFVPGNAGLMGRLPLGQEALTLRAVTRGGAGPVLAYAAHAGGRDFAEPTLVARAGASVRVKLVNAMAEPTVVHWHGFTIDTQNDGNGESPVAPGQDFTYAFTVRNRAGLYWYHPHPHGITAGQVRRGLLGLFMVEDADEFALRRALALVPGETEIPLLLTDRRSGAAEPYSPSPADLLHGWYGDEALVNFTPRPFRDVAARRYRLRVLNGANARIFRLGFTRDGGGPLPFLLLGTDGGLLERPIPVTEVLVAPAERVDLLVDFAGLPVGSFVLLDSRPFDPMHAELAVRRTTDSSTDTAAHGAEIAPGSAMAASHGDGGAFALLQFRIRERGRPSAAVPGRLSTMPAIRPSTGDDRPLRLGFAKGRWRINDLVYDTGATPIVVVRSTVETWLIRNYHTSMPHAMHLHGFQFRVLSRETSPDQLAQLDVDNSGRLATDLGLKDTILVWPGESVKIAIDFAHPFAGPQIYLFHCHNLEHEDGGMMLRVQVG